MYGKPVSLTDFRGQRVLLTFSDPDCGPCEALAPSLVEAHRRQKAGRLALVLVGRGEVEANRQGAEHHGYEFPVVVQKGWNLSREYGIFATPVAFLIDEQGVIATDVAKGVEEILALLSGPRRELHTVLKDAELPLGNVDLRHLRSTIAI